MASQKVCAIIAAYNEEKYIGSVIPQVEKYVDTVFVVNDGSRDKTAEIAKDKGATVLTHIINLGKGAAIRTGCDYALKKGFQKMVLIDADGQHDPKEIPKFLSQLEQHDIVFGYRKFNKSMPVIFRIGNAFINKAIHVLYNISLNDTQCGYRAFNKDAYMKIRWQAGDYFMESEMIANLGKTKLRYAQLPIETIYADKYKGTTVVDGMKIVLNMFLWRLRR